VMSQTVISLSVSIYRYTTSKCKTPLLYSRIRSSCNREKPVSACLVSFYELPSQGWPFFWPSSPANRSWSWHLASSQP